MSSDANHEDKTGPAGGGYSFEAAAGEESLDEVINQSRLRQVYQRRNSAYEALSGAGEAVVREEGVNQRQTDLMIESRVRAYAVELRSLMRRAADDGVVGQNWWESGVQIDAPIQPPADAEVPDINENPGALTTSQPVINPNGERSEEPLPVVVGGEGVGVIREYESPLTLTWEIVDETSTGRKNRESYTVQRTLPRNFVLSVLESCDEFLGAAGLDISLQPDKVVSHGDGI